MRDVLVTVKATIKRATAATWPRLRRLRLNATLYCSFCGKSEHEVAKLIAGPTVFICDGCIELCNKVIEETAGTQVPETRALEQLASMSTDRLLHLLKIQGAAFEHARAGLQNAVDTLRKRGVSWAAIGEALGVSRQAAWERFS